MIVYRAANGTIWCRPKSVFDELVDVDGKDGAALRRQFRIAHADWFHHHCRTLGRLVKTRWPVAVPSSPCRCLILSGMTPLAANITSTVALFPRQVTTGFAGRSKVSGAGRLPFWGLFIISIVGGALGGLLLLFPTIHRIRALGAMAGAIRHRSFHLG